MNHAETWDGMGRPWMVTVVGSSVLGDPGMYSKNVGIISPDIRPDGDSLTEIETMSSVLTIFCNRKEQTIIGKTKNLVASN